MGQKAIAQIVFRVGNCVGPGYLRRNIFLKSMLAATYSSKRPGHQGHAVEINSLLRSQFQNTVFRSSACSVHSLILLIYLQRY